MYQAEQAFGNQQRTVGQLLERMAESQSGRVAKDLARNEGAQTAINDMKARKEQARRTLREVAIQAKAEGNPLSKSEAMSLLKRLESRARLPHQKLTERDAIGNIASIGSTKEVLGESHLSDEAWKSKSTKEIRDIPVMSEAQQISDEVAVPYCDKAGDIAGYRVGAQLIGDETKNRKERAIIPDDAPERALQQFIAWRIGKIHKVEVRPESSYR